MLIIQERFLHMNAIQVRSPESPQDVYPSLASASTVMVSQCADQVAEALRPFAFRWKVTHTRLVDLTRSEGELWSDISPRTRSYINQAKRTAPFILLNEETQEAFRLINEFIARRRYRRPVSPAEWASKTAHGDVFLLKHQDRAIAAQLILVDDPMRATLVLDASIDRSNAQVARLVGPLHKLLFWAAFQHYRAKGIRWFDMGGIVLDEASPQYSISQFKHAFGGTVIHENILLLARNPLLRTLLAGALNARLMLLARRGAVTSRVS